jgi:hypothetical protein
MKHLALAVLALACTGGAVMAEQARKTSIVGAALSDELVEALPRDDALSIGIGVRGWPR